MYFSVSQLMKEKSGAGRTVEIDDVVALTGGGRPSRVLGSASLLRTDKGVWLSAKLDTDVPCICSRCLSNYEQTVDFTVEEEFLTQMDITTGARVNHGTDTDQSFFIDQNHILDLSEAVRQYTALSVPMKPVCQEDCAGICSTCGANLNDNGCTCGRERRDGRLSVLMELGSVPLTVNS